MKKKSYSKCFFSQKLYEPSRIRTYIENLEGFCPNPLDDGPI